MLPSYYESVRELDDDVRLEIWDAMMDFGMAGKEPENLSVVAKALFALMQPNIAKSVAYFESKHSNGKKGGRPSKVKPNENLNKTQTKPSRKHEYDSEYDCENKRWCKTGEFEGYWEVLRDGKWVKRDETPP